MAFAAPDYFEAEHPPPADTEPPQRGALFDYLVDRLFDSFGLPLGPARYLELMSPVLPTANRAGADRGSRRTVAPGG
jgi:hypothetical protein